MNVTWNIAVLWLLMGCAKSTPRTDLAHHYLACTAALQAAAWTTYEHDCLAGGFVRHTRDGSEMKRDDVLEYWKNVKLAFPDLRLQPQFVVVDHNEVSAVLLATGTQDGVLRCADDLPASHRKIGLFVVERVTFDAAGHATDEWLEYDANTVLGQVGAVPNGAPPIATGWPNAPVIAVRE